MRVVWCVSACMVLGLVASAGCSKPQGSTTQITETDQQIMVHTSRSPNTANRLVNEQSPYLLQHAYNPVDWYPWGDEAIAKARREQKPIFLSIGYSTCHWCHVMERESFENPEIADLMNRWFVSIKVDREEHPDLDHVYMGAVMALTGRGGWPLTVLLTPDLKPFFGGTYFPPERRGSMTGMRELLPAVADAWNTKREQLISSSEQITRALRVQLANDTQAESLKIDTIDAAFKQAVGTFDSLYGGFGGAPKFPRSHEISFLLAYWARTKSEEALNMSRTTLDNLRRGGIHDHLGGGFHRYSTDLRWLVPHFEKMLYDQALLARSFLEAYRITGEYQYADTARSIFEYVLRDLTDPKGGFYSAEDADSEGTEGKFYVWTQQEIFSALELEEAELFSQFYGVTAAGNFSVEGAEDVEAYSANILNISEPLEVFAKRKSIDVKTLSKKLAAARNKLFSKRAKRIRPHLDDKVLTSWNGLMISSLAYGASTLNEPRYLHAAERAADFILKHLMREDTILRRYRNGEAAYPGTLEDYAFFTYGHQVLIALHNASHYHPLAA